MPELHKTVKFSFPKLLVMFIFVLCANALFAQRGHYGRMERQSYSNDGSGWGFTILLLIVGVVYLVKWYNEN